MKKETVQDRNRYNDALVRLVKYCAYQDRCLSEVQSKLYELELSQDESQKIIDYLVTEKYLNEERYLRAIIRGKFFHKNWGKLKVSHFLKVKNVSNTMFDKVWEEQIDPLVYEKSIIELIDKKIRTTKAKSDFELKQKIIQSLYQKGFESFLVEPLVEQVLHRGV